MNRKQHWEAVYGTKSDQAVGWFQENPETSINLVEKYAPETEARIIDVGGGNSYLTKILFDLGYQNITVLDISSKALERSISRFGKNIGKLSWVESDILEYVSPLPFQVWHDRAVFHFLTDEKEIYKYAEVAAKNILKDGFLFLGTFSLTGPQTCSGLEITQYSEKMFCGVFDDFFDLVECFENVHTTPSGNPQNFIWIVFKRKEK